MLQIPKPCDADWDQMSKEDIGRHCCSCNKTVVDFTKMNAEEIKVYLSVHSNQKTCGRFLTEQVSNSEKENLPDLLRRQYVNKNYFRFIQPFILLVLTFSIWISSCIRRKAVPTKQLIENNPHIMGDIVYREPISDTSKVRKDSTPVKARHDEYLMGKVRMIDTVNQRIIRTK